MTLQTTLAILAGFVLAALICGWLGARPTRPGRVRMAPWRFMMLLAAAGAILMIVHLVNLLGVTTGR
ncbi:MAG: hypothetical protein IT546_10380 [Caulobacteraceae bacterium]|jgi:hypothetical protein|nr:hypothetical protein [Caulobacteraceae bacterium]